MDTQAVLTEIKERLNGVCKEGTKPGVAWRYRDWTREVKKALCDVGKCRGYTVWANGLGGDLNEEWLYDVVWVENVAKEWWSAIRSIPLAAESEWGHWRAVEADFDKLITSRARIRVLIFDLGRTDMDAFKELTDRAAQFVPDGFESHNLLAGWSVESGRFAYHEF